MCRCCTQGLGLVVDLAVMVGIMVGVNGFEGFSQPKQFCDSKDTAYVQLQLRDNIGLPGTILKIVIS